MPATAPHPILRIVLPYAAFATLWIYASDAVLARWMPDPAALTRLQTFKGFGFVLITAALLYVLLRREFALRDRARSEHERLRQRLVDILESITDGFVGLDREWRYTYVNRRAGDMLGQRPARLIGKQIWKEFPEGVGQPFYHAYHKVMAERVPQTIEEHYPPWNRWFENRIYPTPEGIAIFFQEITERKLSEQRLRESEERFRATFEQAAVGVAHVAADGRWLRVNRKLCGIVGYSEEELLARTFQDITHPDDRDADRDFVRRVLAGDMDTYALEKRYVRKDGSTIWVELTVSLVREASQAPKYFIAVVEDITRRKEAEAAVRISEERFRRMAESTSAAIFIVQDGRLRFVNPQAERLTGYSREQLRQMDGWALVHPRFRPALQARAAARLQGDAVPGAIEVTILRSDGGERWVEMTATLIDFDGAPAILGTAYDVTERKAAENELHRAHDELEQRVANRTVELQRANTALQNFTYMVSHDLRTPLRAMQGFAQAVLEDHVQALPADGREYVQRIAGAAARMDQLMQDLLAYSKVERALLTLKRVALTSAVTAAMVELEHEIAARGATVDVDVAPVVVRAHGATLAQVIGNLLANALRFTAPGVVPRVRLYTQRADSRVRLIVEDNGIGIAPEHFDRIFMPFERLHGIETYAGTGIGLAIVQKAMERMDGGVGVESLPGRGSRFWIELSAANGETTHGQ